MDFGMITELQINLERQETQNFYLWPSNKEEKCNIGIVKFRKLKIFDTKLWVEKKLDKV